MMVRILEFNTASMSGNLLHHEDITAIVLSNKTAW